MQRKVMRINRPGHEEHGLWAMGTARHLALWETSPDPEWGTHDNAESYVFTHAEDEDFCFPCLVMALLELIHEPRSPKQLEDEYEAIDRLGSELAFGEVKRQYEKRRKEDEEA